MAQSHIATTHERAHADDLLALWEIHHAGNPEQFAHIEQGLRIRYVRKDKEIKDEGAITYIGMGRGRYDEHGKNIPESSASLVGADLGLLKRFEQDCMFHVTASGAKHLFVVEDPKLRDLFAALVRDDISGSPPYSFGNTVDTIYHHYPRGLRRVKNWAWRLFDAVTSVGPIPVEEREAAHQEAAKLLLATAERILHQKRRQYHELAGKRIMEWLTKRLTISDPEPLNLLDAVAVMKRAGADYHKWILLPLRAEIVSQHHFHAISAHEAKKTCFKKIILHIEDGAGTRTEEREIALVQSDDPFVHHYLLWEGSGHNPAVIVKRDSCGCVQIFPGDYQKEVQPPALQRMKNQGYSIGKILDLIWESTSPDDARKRLSEECGLSPGQINAVLGSQLYGLIGLQSDIQRPRKFVSYSLSFLMPTIAGFIRAMERKRKDLNPASWSDLVSVHGPADERTWFFYYTSPKSFKPGWLLNGSLTRDVAPTALSLEEIGEAIIWALDEDYARKRERIVEYLQYTGAARIREWVSKTSEAPLIS